MGYCSCSLFDEDSDMICVDSGDGAFEYTCVRGDKNRVYQSGSGSGSSRDKDEV